MESSIKIVDHDIDILQINQWIESNQAGSIVTFKGTVRNQTADKSVKRLEFEAYIPMAIKELQKIIEDIRQDYPILRVAVHHRVGILPIGGTAVYIAVATAHREAGFAVCKYIIDTLKQTVPIWKKEVFEDGEIWVAAHP